jgi:hypothetical protein
MSKTNFQVKTTKAGDKIVVARGDVVGCSDYINEAGEHTAFRLDIRLEGGERCIGYRGLSLGSVPVSLPDNEGNYPAKDSFYVKEDDFAEYGNTAWNLGFAPIDDFDPFAEA